MLWVTEATVWDRYDIKKSITAPMGDEYEVEAILDDTTRADTRCYLVKWKGYDDPNDLTWEPDTSLDGCGMILERYLARRKKQTKSREPTFPTQPTGPSPYAYFTPEPLGTDDMPDPESIIAIHSVARVRGKLRYRCDVAGSGSVVLSSAELSRPSRRIPSVGGEVMSPTRIQSVSPNCETLS
jgi:hypothetical protein